MSSDPNQPPPQYPPAYYPPPAGYYPPPAYVPVPFPDVTQGPPALPPPPPPPVDRTNTHLLAFIAAMIAAPLIGAVLYFGIKGYERERDRREMLRLEHEETLIHIEQLKVEEEMKARMPGAGNKYDAWSAEFDGKIKPFEERRDRLRLDADFIRRKHGW